MGGNGHRAVSNDSMQRMTAHRASVAGPMNVILTVRSDWASVATIRRLSIPGWSRKARIWHIELSDNGMHAYKAWASVASGCKSHKQRAAARGDARIKPRSDQRRVSTARA
jgi:hypothetical protein